MARIATIDQKPEQIVLRDPPPRHYRIPHWYRDGKFCAICGHRRRLFWDGICRIETVAEKAGGPQLSFHGIGIPGYHHSVELP